MTQHDSKRSTVPARVSVIVIAYNEQDRIGECLGALAAQTTAVPFQVVVVDDGSTDRTAQIVEELATRDSRFRLIRHAVNRGRGAARRTGQEAVDSSLIGFVDADVDVPENWIERCVEELRTCSAVSGIARPDGDCAVIWRIFHLAIRERPSPATITGNNVMFRAEALELEPFESHHRLGEDFRQAHRLAARGLELRSVPDLQVLHLESRTYGGALKWMWQLGVDAASHPFVLKIVRLPDLTWVLWWACIAGTVAAAAATFVSWWLVSLTFLIATGAVNFVYFFTRFHLGPAPIRWFVGAIANIPLMTSYLFGRTWGLIALPIHGMRAYRISHRSGH